MKPLACIFAAALVVLALALDRNPPAEASAAAIRPAVYYPAIATYDSNRSAAELEQFAGDQPYFPPARTPVQQVSYAGNYAAGYRPGYSINACASCYGGGYGYFGDGGPVFYGWNGNGFPIARGAWRVATFPARAWLAWAPIRRLFGRC